MEKTISVKSLALANISKKPYRTAALTVLVALAAGVLFGTLLLTASIKGGLGGIKNRIGADLMIVPQGYESQAEGVLLSGEPSYFYMDKAIEETIGEIQGVAAVTSQFYLTSLSESCCDFPIQIIGFDPSSDFIIKSWTVKKVLKSSGDEVILAGSNISTEKNTLRFFEGTHEVSARLAKSGTGMDNVVYTDLDTLQQIFEDAKEKGFGFISDGDTKTKVSTVFVKLAPGAKPDSTALRIKNALPDVQVLQSGSFLSNLADRISGFLIFPRVLSLLILIITIFTLGVVFSLIANERVREYSILRVLGADRSTLKKLILNEAAAIGLIGSVIGLFLAAITVLPFNVLISEKIGLPFSLANPLALIGLTLLVLGISLVSCLLAALYSAIRISKQEVIFK